MFNFKEITYISRDLMADKRLSIGAKYLFSIIDEKCYLDNKETIHMSNKEAMEELAIKSTTTLMKVKKELTDNGFIKIETKKNKVYYTPAFSYLKGDK